VNLRFTIYDLRLRRLAGRPVFVGACGLAGQLQAQPSNAVPALIPAYAELPMTFWERHGTFVIIGVIAFFILAAFAVWKRWQPQPPVILPPETVARAALQKLLPAAENGKVLSEVSQILRRYVIAAFGLPAAEMTTKEFCAVISGHEKIGAELAGKISGLLHVCDRDKFSPKSVAPPINAVDRAGELIALAESARTETHRRDACATTT
jgi:hypothetical protein